MTDSFKKRLDIILVERGLAPSRSKAQALIADGKVFCGDSVLTKASELIDPDAAIELRGVTDSFASRGGLKLDAAVKHFQIDCRGEICIDVGASTGGFTDVLLHNGAARVLAVDVGEGQLIDRLRNDARVTMLEKTNIRHFTADQLPPDFHDFQIVVCDVSFISIIKALPPLLAMAPKNCVFIALIKPQFEVGAGKVGKGGIVKDPAEHVRVCAEIETWLAQDMGWQVQGIMDSPIEGQDGNKEFLICAKK